MLKLKRLIPKYFRVIEVETHDDDDRDKAASACVTVLDNICTSKNLSQLETAEKMANQYKILYPTYEYNHNLINSHIVRMAKYLAGKN